MIRFCEKMKHKWTYSLVVEPHFWKTITCVRKTGSTPWVKSTGFCSSWLSWLLLGGYPIFGSLGTFPSFFCITSPYTPGRHMAWWGANKCKKLAGVAVSIAVLIHFSFHQFITRLYLSRGVLLFIPWSPSLISRGGTWRIIPLRGQEFFWLFLDKSGGDVGQKWRPRACVKNMMKPIGCMGLLYICLHVTINKQPNVVIYCKYTSPMDPMGKWNHNTRNRDKTSKIMPIWGNIPYDPMAFRSWGCKAK